MKRTYHFGILFLIAAILIFIFVFEVPWWAAILVSLLAAGDFTIETTR